ncbi:MAG: J domain-containing protein [Bradyrhizobium sp.]|uniref:J domain-containing protein n=1 Tax=Bradyrhizobium sp. TaxID=376 RepID=UPI001D2478D3|nr:J domain-containing protein [Bradyrhizobium sp.]MBV9564924.1 J domain-containing protein [Bradyrhizobium sp.]
MKTLYEVLGVWPDASQEALKAAYRRLAKIHHPDLNPGDPDAARRFRQITIAIRILRDAKRRGAYDQRLARARRRRFDHAGEQRRLRRSRLIITGVVAAAMMSLVLMIESTLVRSIRPMSGVTGRTAEIVAQAPGGGLAKHHRRLGPETFKTAIHVPAVGPDLRIALDRRDEGLVRPEQDCQDGTGNGTHDRIAGSLTAAYDVGPFEVGRRCKPQNDHGADEEISANQRAALMRQAQELLASGDPANAHRMSQRACRNARSRCGLGRHENL